MDNTEMFQVVDALSLVAELTASGTEEIIDALVPVAFSEEEAGELKLYYNHVY